MWTPMGSSAPTVQPYAVVVLNCKAERDNTNANKHDRCNRSCSCIYILNRELSNKFRCNLHLQILASLLVVLKSFTSFRDPFHSINLHPSSNLFKLLRSLAILKVLRLTLRQLVWIDTRIFSTTWVYTASIQARQLHHASNRPYQRSPRRIDSRNSVMT